MSTHEESRSYRVYGLREPGNNVLRYVGSTRMSLANRLSGHITEATRCKTPTAKWIKSLLSDGKRPEIFVLEECVGLTRASALEREWIARMRDVGELTNVHDSGPLGGPATETERRSCKLVAITLPDTEREKLDRLAIVWRMPKSTAVRRLIHLAEERPLTEQEENDMPSMITARMPPEAIAKLTELSVLWRLPKSTVLAKLVMLADPLDPPEET